MKDVQIITSTNPNRDKLVFLGPMEFKARCGNCEVPRNKHGQRCLACPGWHKKGCMEGYDSGFFH